VAKQHAAAVSLRDKIVDAPTKDLLRPVLNSLTDVDSVFLSSVRDDRTASQEAWWLDWADLTLQAAVAQLHDITELVQKYGGPEKVRTIR